MKKEFIAIRKRIYKRILKIKRMLEPNPYKVAELWRRAGVKVGSNTCIYRNVVISGDGEEPISIGMNCVLTGCALIAHDASTNRYLGINYGEPSPSMPIVIEDNCFIGYGAIVLMSVRIGRDSIVGAGAVVTKDVPPRSVVGGNPAKVICSLDDLIEKRRKILRN
jgi:acetyltransferase-like isoleucine patch superfamily enzyme